MVDAAIGKIIESFKYMKNSEVRLEKFSECLSNLRLPCSKKLRQEVPIQWNSTYQMIESALLYQLTYIYYDLVDPSFRYGLFKDEWKKVEIVATFLGHSMISPLYFADASAPQQICIFLI